jgi:ABC-2 type transport system permease protein
MTSLSHTLGDSTTMLRRDLLRSVRNPMMTLSGLMTPIIMLALFNYVFGGAIGSGIGASLGMSHGGAYINYLAPAIIIMTVGSGCASTAVNLVTDLNEGIVTRFRTMAIARASVLNGQVLGSMIRTVVSAVLVTGVAFLMGFRPTADLVAWIKVFGMVALFALALTWMGVLFGLVGKTPAGANSLAQLFQLLLPFTSSAFVPTASMSGAVRWFADNQPFTVVINTLRGLLFGTPIGGHNAMLAIAWCIGIALFGYVCARAAYNRGPAQ